MSRYVKPLKFPLWARNAGSGTANSRHTLSPSGIQADLGNGAKLPYSNHIETAGFKTASIVSYKIDKGHSAKFYRFCVFPSLRVLPNDTRGSLTYAFPEVKLRVNGEREQTERMEFDGILKFTSKAGGAKITRRFIPGSTKCALIEELHICANGSTAVSFACRKSKRTVKGKYTASGDSYTLSTVLYADGRALSPKNARVTVQKETTVYIAYAAEPLSLSDVQAQIKLREAFLQKMNSCLKIHTPDEAVNRMLALTKIRAGESIFETKNGLMHAPGGGGYYAALWTNDQCEYANPFFAYLGYDKAMEQSLNCYALYSGLSKPDKAIYTSIIAEGDDYWYGAGDRGDSSMYVYGFSRYLLTTGDRENAQKYLPALETACTYVMSKMNSENVIESDSDELENRFESGSANLSTAVISYDAFLSMSYLERELGNNEKSALYRECSEKIKSGISSYFEANVEGFETYRYCKEEQNLRSWICLPMTVGITNRTEGTLAALRSDKLKKDTGLLTRSGTKTYWDRSLLYALRALFYAGKADDALEMLQEYTKTRLLGEHAPYPVEAYPEGNAAHLSAESALYGRIFTEGVLGFRPLGFHTFALKPHLPRAWDSVSVSGFYYDNRPLTVEVKVLDGKATVTIPELHYCEAAAIGEGLTVEIQQNH